MSELAPPFRLIHMAETMQRLDGTFIWFCRCGEQAGGFTDRQFARRDGDAHLRKANSD